MGVESGNSTTDAAIAAARFSVGNAGGSTWGRDSTTADNEAARLSGTTADLERTQDDWASAAEQLLLNFRDKSFQLFEAGDPDSDTYYNMVLNLSRSLQKIGVPINQHSFLIEHYMNNVPRSDGFTVTDFAHQNNNITIADLTDVRHLRSSVEGYEGSFVASLGAMLTKHDGQPTGGEENPLDQTLQDILAGLSRGSGSGSRGPVYRRPDEDLVRDFVRQRLRITVGHVNEGRVENLKDIFMRQHRADFDNPEQDMDAQQAVKEAIRKTTDYQAIHKLRPENVDEDSWLIQFVQSQANQGANPNEGLDRARLLATAGDPNVSNEVNQQATTSRAPGIIERAQSVAGALGGVFR